MRSCGTTLLRLWFKGVPVRGESEKLVTDGADSAAAAAAGVKYAVVGIVVDGIVVVVVVERGIDGLDWWE